MEKENKNHKISTVIFSYLWLGEKKKILTLIYHLDNFINPYTWKYVKKAI